LAVANLFAPMLSISAAEPSGAEPVATASASPRYQAAARDVSVNVGERSFSARVAYPAGLANDGEAVPIAHGRFPAIVFGHGYLATVERYESTLRALAARGFLVVAPRSGDGPFPSHAAFASDFSVVLDWLEREDETAGSWLAGHVLRGAYGASGHSMGGGASLLAAAADARFVTVANLAAAETDPSAIDAVVSIAAPVLLIAGSDDAIAPVADHQRPMFEAKTTGPVQLRIIAGGSHCGFLAPDPVLALACDHGSMPAQEELAIADELLGDWFRYELAGERSLEAVVWPDTRDSPVSLESRGHLPP
jgi:predicted dienelactone hydrolase